MTMCCERICSSSCRKQIAGIRGRQCPGRQPTFQLRLERAREVAVAEPALDCRELVVAGRSTAGECSNDAGVDPDLLGDMVEHDGGQQLAAAQVASRIAESTQLQCVGQARFWSAGVTDRCEVRCIQAVVPHHELFGVGQREQRRALPLGHWHTTRHGSFLPQTSCHSIAQ
jgi:hypothetical protein